MLSGRGLCDELITHPEESYRMWCVVVCDLETSRIGAPYIYIYIYIYIYDISSLRVKQLRTAKHPTNLRFYNYHQRNSQEFAEMQVTDYSNFI